MKQKIALVHDYLSEAGGAERVLRVLSDMYPEAPIYTAFAKRGTARAMLAGRRIVESPWAWLLKMGRMYSYLRFLLPWIWRSVDLRAYDVVITSCSGYIARGFKVRSDAKVIAYCHTPPRWLYGYETPTGAMGKWWGKVFMWVGGPFLRYFDFVSAQRVDVWVANSHEVEGRIEKFYRKKAVVVYPPIEVLEQKNKNIEYRREEYYLLVTRVTGAKGVLEAARAAERGKFRLKIVGEDLVNYGARIGNGGKSVEYLGRVDDKELAELYASAKGFIALARDEDFGMTVVEAMSCGTPVLAFNGGGYKETVKDPDNQKTQRIGASDKSESRRKQKFVQTGVLIDKTDPESVIKGIQRMEKTKWDREGIMEWAGKFNRAKFEKEMRRVIDARTT